MIEAGIVSLLQGNYALAALIGTGLYPVLLPEGAVYPCVTYSVVSSTNTYSFETKEVSRKRIDFNCFGNTYSDCKAVKQAIRNALDGYVGTFADGTRVIGTYRGVELDFFEDDARVYRTLTEYIFEFVEP